MMFLQDRITHVTCESTVELRIGAGVTAARTLGRPLKDARWRISAQPFLAAILTVFARVALFASLAGAAPAVASAASGAAIPAPAPTRASRTLIIIIPGTHGNENFWPVISPGNVTFGSELQRGAGAGSDVYPFLWSAPNEQTQRMQAARNLAAVIDDKAGRYDRSAWWAIAMAETWRCVPLGCANTRWTSSSAFQHLICIWSVRLLQATCSCRFTAPPPLGTIFGGSSRFARTWIGCRISGRTCKKGSRKTMRSIWRRAGLKSRVFRG